MVTVTCPWCEADQPLRIVGPEDPQTPFHCHECGTTVLWRDEPDTGLDLADSGLDLAA